MKKNTIKIISVIISLIVIVSSLTVMATADSGYGYLVASEYVSPNTGKDVSDDIQKLIDENPNRTIFFSDGEYLLSKPIYTPADPRRSVSLKLSEFAVFKATGDWSKGEAVVQLGGIHPANDTHTNGSNYSLEGGIIDGSNIANGVSINGGRETAVRNVSIKHTVIGLHIMRGANGGSSDSDITGLNIIGTGTTESVGILVEGWDNTITNVRIGFVFIGMQIRSAGNIFRNIHPLYYSDYTDYQNSCGFLVESGNNWFDYCYSDQFGVAFRTTDNGSSIFHNCFCYWYSPNGGTQTAFKADQEFNSVVTNFKAGFRGDTENNVMLSVRNLNGDGRIENLTIDSSQTIEDFSYKAYEKESNIFDKIFGYCYILVNIIRDYFANVTK